MPTETVRASTTTAPHSGNTPASSAKTTAAAGSHLREPRQHLREPSTSTADGDFDATTGVDNPWDFGESWQYPVLKYGMLDPAKQRPQVTLAVGPIDEDVTATQDRTSNLPTEVTLSVPAGSTLSDRQADHPGR